MDLSIIIPTYKRIAQLEKTLRSISSACPSEYETIVIDDCPDGSAFSIAKKYNAKYFYKNGTNRGQAKSRNLGIQISSGRFLIFVDDDDFFNADGISDLQAATSAGYSFVFGNYTVLSNDKLTLNDTSSYGKNELLVMNRIPIGSYIIEKTMIKNGFDERINSHEDWEFLLNNVNWNKSIHIDKNIVTIDKTKNKIDSYSAMRRKFFWMDFISIYSRYPAPELIKARKSILAKYGVNIKEEMLDNSVKNYAVTN